MDRIVSQMSSSFIKKILINESGTSLIGKEAVANYWRATYYRSILGLRAIVEWLQFDKINGHVHKASSIS